MDGHLVPFQLVQDLIVTALVSRVLGLAANGRRRFRLWLYKHAVSG